MGLVVCELFERKGLEVLGSRSKLSVDVDKYEGRWITWGKTMSLKSEKSKTE